MFRSLSVQSLVSQSGLAKDDQIFVLIFWHRLWGGERKTTTNIATSGIKENE